MAGCITDLMEMSLGPVYASLAQLYSQHGWQGRAIAFTPNIGAQGA